MATVKKKKETTIDDLAVMIAKGFDGIENEIGGMKNDVKNLKLGQDDIRNKLDNVAYRFELVELDKRVRVLEKKVK